MSSISAAKLAELSQAGARIDLVDVARPPSFGRFTSRSPAMFPWINSIRHP